MTRVLTADLATTTGIGVALPGENLRLFHFTIGPKSGPPLPYGPFFTTFRRLFNALLDRERPDVVVFEAPVLNSYRIKGKNGAPDTLLKDNMTKVRKLCGMVAIVQEVCTDRGIAWREYQPAEVKKALCGNANANKDRMMDAAKIMGFDPQTDDEADALGLMVLASERYLPRLHAALRDRQKRPAWFENISALKKQASQKRAVTKAKKAKTDIRGTLL